MQLSPVTLTQQRWYPQPNHLVDECGEAQASSTRDVIASPPNSHLLQMPTWPRTPRGSPNDMFNVSDEGDAEFDLSSQEDKMSLQEALDLTFPDASGGTLGKFQDAGSITRCMSSGTSIPPEIQTKIGDYVTKEVVDWFEARGPVEKQRIPDLLPTLRAGASSSNGPSQDMRDRRATLIQFIALDLLASVFTITPDISIGELPTALYLHQSRPQWVSALRMHTWVHSVYSAAAGHHARDSSVAPAWPGLLERDREEVWADEITRRRLRKIRFQRRCGSKTGDSHETSDPRWEEEPLVRWMWDSPRGLPRRTTQAGEENMEESSLTSRASPLDYVERGDDIPEDLPLWDGFGTRYSNAPCRTEQPESGTPTTSPHPPTEESGLIDAESLSSEPGFQIPSTAADDNDGIDPVSNMLQRYDRPAPSLVDEARTTTLFGRRARQFEPGQEEAREGLQPTVLGLSSSETSIQPVMARSRTQQCAPSVDTPTPDAGTAFAVEERLPRRRTLHLSARFQSQSAFLHTVRELVRRPATR